MAIYDMNNAVASDLTNTITDFSIDAVNTDAAGEQKETSWINSRWADFLGYYKAIPELAAAIDAKATWTIGKGFKADPQTTFILDSLKGWNKDTFNTILENMIRTYYIGGDAFCEIIRDDKRNLINLKPLDPGSIKIVVNRQGLIIRYEQVSKTKNAPKKFEPETIFHLSKNRVADEIHGNSIIPPLEKIILWRNEAMKNQDIIFKRFVYPRWIIKLDTDDKTKISNIKTKWDKANADGENMYIPQGTVEVEQMSISPNSTLNPQPWIDKLNDYFYEACGTPKVILGGSGEFTEATAKIVYLAFEQNVREEQLFLKEQIDMQLGLEIELEFPASLENELLSDNAKDGGTQTQPNETTAGSGQ